MATIDDNWLIPLTANDKNYRATYRSVVKGCYVEDFSYFQCIEIKQWRSCPDLTIVAFGEIQSDVNNLGELATNCWLTYKEETIGQAIYLKSTQSFFWIHPSTFSRICESFEATGTEFAHRTDLDLFMLLGPKAPGLLLDPDADVKDICRRKIRELPLSQGKLVDEEEITLFRSRGDKQSNLGSAFYILLSKATSFKVWLRLTHLKVFVGCLDTQEHLNVELEQLSSPKLMQDANLRREKSHTQLELLGLANHWWKDPKNELFRILRNTRTLRMFDAAIKKNTKVEFEADRIPAFVPVVVRSRFVRIHGKMP